MQRKPAEGRRPLWQELLISLFAALSVAIFAHLSIQRQFRQSQQWTAKQEKDRIYSQVVTLSAKYRAAVLAFDDLDATTHLRDILEGINNNPVSVLNTPTGVTVVVGDPRNATNSSFKTVNLLLPPPPQVAERAQAYAEHKGVLQSAKTHFAKPVNDRIDAFLIPHPYPVGTNDVWDYAIQFAAASLKPQQQSERAFQDALDAYQKARQSSLNERPDWKQLDGIAQAMADEINATP
jgi:hypothetical protein